MNSQSQQVHTRIPTADIVIDTELVSALLARQYPELAHLPLELVGEGWDNMIFRLGEELVVRLPRRTIGVTLMEREQLWLPRIAPSLPLPTSSPLYIGEPDETYPWKWSILPWLEGETADQNEPLAEQAPTLIRFLHSLHTPPPSDAPQNPMRGVPLVERRVNVEERMDRLATQTDLITPQLRNIWEEGVNAEIDLPPTWIHGDLHPRNILVRDGKLAGIIDWGDITSGDPATDLSSLWMLFPDPATQQRALSLYNRDITPDTVKRAKGWAVLVGLAMLETGLHDNPAQVTIGMRTLQRVVQ